MRALAPALLGALVFPAGAQGATPRRHAVVVGVESYESLGGVGAQGARGSAARVAGALEAAGFQDVRLLTDASASRRGLQTLLEREVGPALGPDDLFLFYFEGLGVGGDFGEPRLLLYDSDVDSLPQSSWSTADLGRDLARWVRAGTLVLVTDASRPGKVGDLALLGPSAEDWPDLGRPAVRVASCAPREVGVPGAFAAAFAEGISGAADAGADGRVTSGELVRWLVTAVPQATRDQQHPMVDARYDPSVLLSAAGPATGGARVDKVKFVFKGGISPTVQCQGAAPVACSPSCYLWDLAPGTCRVSAVYDGERRVADLEVLQRGRWICNAGLDHRLTCHE